MRGKPKETFGMSTTSKKCRILQAIVVGGSKRPSLRGKDGERAFSSFTSTGERVSRV